MDWAHAAQHVHARAVASAIDLLASPQAAQSARYFTDNANRMRYADFRAQGLPIGNGSVESVGKTVIQHRLKSPCRGWTRANAKAMIVALCELHSNRLDAMCRQL